MISICKVRLMEGRLLAVIAAAVTSSIQDQGKAEKLRYIYQMPLEAHVQVRISHPLFPLKPCSWCTKLIKENIGIKHIPKGLNRLLAQFSSQIQHPRI